MITSSLERLRNELAREAVNSARKNGARTVCPCCGARMVKETQSGSIFLYCGHCLFTTSSDRCEGFEA